MQSTAARLAIAVVAIAIVVVGFIALSGGDDSDDSTTQTTPTVAEDTTSGGSEKPGNESGNEPAADVPVIQIKDGEAVGGVQELTFSSGDTIEFEVESDAAHEIHFHGYDVAQEVEAGGSTEFSVPADIEGVFEVEIEDTATPIAELTVNP